LIKDIKQYAGGKNLTESLVTALQEWLSLKKIKALNDEIKKNPLEFCDAFSPESIRELNRKK